ncbi:MAG: PadR family transcriptional regulator [Acholeplasmataceae bacterium]|nr:PadR family transcriptional regulator [Acholeplasmataceae bacterium]
MNSQFRKGILEMCVLALINRHDMYGFEVIETLASSIPVNENTIYPILRRLTGQALFETYEEQTNIGAPRKYYRITQTGKERLASYENEWTSFLKGVFEVMGGNET